jgi:hypothetical protein
MDTAGLAAGQYDLHRCLMRAGNSELIKKGAEMKVFNLIGSTAAAFLIAVTVSTGAANAHALKAAEGPYCPELAPLAGRYINSGTSNGHYYDAYLVPFFLGYTVKTVTCP